MKKLKNGRVIIFSIGHKCDSKTIQRNVLSVQKQVLDRKFFHIIVSDGSNNLGFVLPKFGHIRHIKNNFRYGIRNLLHLNEYIISSDDIIVILNLQDWLSDKYSLQTIVDFHQYNGALLTYGGYMLSNSADRVIENIDEINCNIDIDKDTINQIIPSLPITFRAYLFKEIYNRLLKMSNNNKMTSCYDVPLFHLLYSVTQLNKIKMVDKIVMVKNVDYIDNTYNEELDFYLNNYDNIIPNMFDVIKTTHEGIINLQKDFVLIPVEITNEDIIKYRK